jgi:sulfite reductase (NADPH) flavoprotein alpha-component
MTFNRQNPYFAPIIDRCALTKPGSGKRTEHIVLDLAGSGLKYEAGDSIAVLPMNDPGVVAKTLQAMKATGEERIADKRSGETYLLNEFLTKKGNISTVSKKLVQEVYQKLQSEPKKGEIAALLEDKERLKAYLSARELWDFLEEHKEAAFVPEELCQLLQPLLPRFYSIASSPTLWPNEVHLTVAYLNYVSNSKERKGVCTNYLCENTPLLERIPVYVQPSNGFALPQEGDAPIIMIGPGTGVAPFRAFMQERIAKGARGKNWLFFGEWNRAFDFFYEEYWSALQAAGQLQLEAAFSRDQGHKVYVQHRMLARGDELFQWLQEGAYLYVCGNADKMAKDVDEALHAIIEQHGFDAKAYVKQLRQQKRYLRDVY